MTADARHTVNQLVADGTLHVEPLADVVVDAVGYHPASEYCERYWLPILGPSALWMARRFAMHLDTSPSGVVVPVEALAAELGIGASGPHSPLVRTAARLVDFGMAAVVGDTLRARRYLPPLAARHLRRLPAHLAAVHDTMSPTGTYRPIGDGTYLGPVCGYCGLDRYHADSDGVACVGCEVVDDLRADAETSGAYDEAVTA